MTTAVVGSQWRDKKKRKRSERKDVRKKEGSEDADPSNASASSSYHQSEMASVGNGNHSSDVKEEDQHHHHHHPTEGNSSGAANNEDGDDIGTERLAWMLLQHGAQVDCRDRDGKTPLIKACFAGQAILVALLLRHNADVFAEPFSGGRRNALLAAASRGFDQVVEEIIKHKGNECVNHQNSQGHTALMMAASGGYCRLAGRLLEAKARLNTRTTVVGDTALMRAALKKHLAMCALLIAQNADVNQRNLRGDNALSWASLGGNHHVVTLLCYQKADVNCKINPDGATPLVIAVKNGNMPVVRCLLEQKARPTAADRETAIRHGNIGVARYLDQIMGMHHHHTLAGGRSTANHGIPPSKGSNKAAEDNAASPNHRVGVATKSSSPSL
mmetsp:Transcript_3487/g.5404  ORF Transcript_3487/g.5404 Transcript_3487/m.5404 type:complete len:386 (+) Transcript_3487:91-1248(+)